MEKKEQLYEGKSKIVYSTDNPELVIQYFKNDVTAFNNQKKESIENKGKICNKISSLIFSYLEDNGIKTHFKERINDNEMLVAKLNIIPVEVVIRNYVAGSLAKRLGLEEGKRLNNSIIEYYYKNDELGDPLINEDHAMMLGLTELEQIKNVVYWINTLLQMMFSRVDIKLVDFKLEFGPMKGKNLFPDMVLGDEISPDSCRLWDMNTNKKLDKDNFRYDLGDIQVTYSDVYCRLMADPKNKKYNE